MSSSPGKIRKGLDLATGFECLRALNLLYKAIYLAKYRAISWHVWLSFKPSTLSTISNASSPIVHPLNCSPLVISRYPSLANAKPLLRWHNCSRNIQISL